MRQAAAMRIAAVLLSLGLVSCGEGEESAAKEPPRGEAIECAIGGAEQFERTCRMEMREDESGLTLTIRNALGGFRRILLPRDNSGAVAADGAERTRVTILPDDRVEVAIGGDRYRLPATIGPRAAQQAR